MNRKGLSLERIHYLKKIKQKKYLVFIVQILILFGFLGIWELCARNGIIDSFITSQPSRILKTLMDLTSNNC